jgi:ABC-2 type transport system permease protein
MRKVLVIARREYLAAVRTKAFLITLLVVPLLMGGSIAVQILVKGAPETGVRHFAVIDRSPGGRLFDAIRASVEKLDAERAAGKAGGPAMEVEQVVPANDSKEALRALRLQLSDRVRRGELQGFVDIGPDVYRTTESGKAGDLLFQTNRPTIQDFPNLVARVVREQVEDERWRQASLDPRRKSPTAASRA